MSDSEDPLGSGRNRTVCNKRGCLPANMRPSTLNTEDNSPITIDFLSSFDIYEEDYKLVDGIPIQATILIPKTPSDGKRPLLVRFHGGAWTEGSGDICFRPW